jgi:hypothetical protein
MFSLLKNRFGVPGLIAVIALVFAMIGGAYAANDSGKATASAKAKKGPRGPKGPKGDTGPAGPAGAAGPAGPAGLKGANGADGAKGDTGAKGSNGAAGAKGAAGATGAAGSPGATGATGPEGSPWTAGGRLPSGATETGVWQTPPVTEAGIVTAPISFTIPLVSSLTGNGEDNQFRYLEEGEGGTEDCPGTIQDPQAAPGLACIYTVSASNASPTETAVGLKSGAFLLYSISEAGGSARGSWAVTAP